MCVYCATGDFVFRHDPPFYVPREHPAFPHLPPHTPPTKEWDTSKMREYLELLKQIKQLEGQLGCSCEPNKADYIGLLEEKLRSRQSGATPMEG